MYKPKLQDMTKWLMERDAQGTAILSLDVAVDRGAQQGKLKAMEVWTAEVRHSLEWVRHERGINSFKMCKQKE